jgi:lysophospholipase L1-like esterase
VWQGGKQPRDQGTKEPGRLNAHVDNSLHKPAVMRVKSLLVPLLALALLGGCKKSSDDDDGNGGVGPSPSTPRYTALGASDAVGIGASVPCLPFTDCPGGTGYVPRVLRHLRESNPDTRLTNMGLPGAVMSREVQDLGNSVGIGINNNFLQHEAPFVPQDTTVVTVFAGANDVNTIATAIDRGAAGSTDPNTYIDRQITEFSNDMTELLGIVRGRAPNTRIVVLNLPNFAALPFAAGRPTRDRLWLQRLSVGFTTQGINRLTGANLTVLDLMCNTRAYQSGTYSSDGFHPSDTGYAFIAEEIIRALNGQAAPPAASCAQMTIVR